MIKHIPQKETDDIQVLTSRDGTDIAVGYKCSGCGNPVFPFGSLLPEEYLSASEKEILNRKCNA